MSTPTDVYVMKNSTVKVGATDYANQCSRSRLVPDTPVQTRRTLVPDGVVQDVDTPSWTWEVAALQKNNTGGLAKALRDAVTAGTETLSIEFIPDNGDAKPEATFTIIPMMVPFGGDQGAWADFEAVFPVLGQPVFGETPEA